MWKMGWMISKKFYGVSIWFLQRSWLLQSKMVIKLLNNFRVLYIYTKAVKCLDLGMDVAKADAPYTTG